MHIFRVDNPHTKPSAFWEWLIAEIRREHPEIIFLAEAFTRPKLMYLARRSSASAQSYSYFTWRNTKEELQDYFIELTTTGQGVLSSEPVRQYARHSSRVSADRRGSGVQGQADSRRDAGATYGIYSGFELIENVADGPDSEEYLQNIKIRLRNYEDPHSLAELIGRINTIRRDHPALQRRQPGCASTTLTTRTSSATASARRTAPT